MKDVSEFKGYVFHMFLFLILSRAADRTLIMSLIENGTEVNGSASNFAYLLLGLVTMGKVYFFSNHNSMNRDSKLKCENDYVT